MRTHSFTAKFFLRCGLLSSALLIPALGFAQGLPMGMHPGHGMPMQAPGMGMGMPHPPQGMHPELKLEEAQRDKMFALHHEQAPAMHKAMQTVQRAHEAMAAMLKSGKFDEAKAKSLSDSAGSAMAEMMLLHARNTAQFRALLTDAQRKTMDDMQMAMPSRGAHPGHVPAGK